MRGAAPPAPPPLEGTIEDLSREPGLEQPELDEPRLPEEVLEAIARTFGIRGLRTGQARAIRAGLEGRDALVVLPTGGGKSLCYQAPALVRPGLTVVVSPLISLMKDQLDGLLACGVPAGMLSSAQDAGDLRDVYRALDGGRLKLLFVSPERLALPGFLQDLERWGLATVAVDEAHCISHWGHDFRPEYRALGEIRRVLPDLPIQAFTATATPAVRADVVRALGLREPEVLLGDFDRPNLTYRARPRHDLGAQLMEVVRAHSGEAGIVYCLSRKETERTARLLAGEGVRCAPYHAGLDGEERARTQDAFQREELEVVCATVAFGMGIDRPDVRFVVHATLPKGMEQYSQESGRAGRDGLKSDCLLLYSGADFHGWRTLIERNEDTSAEEVDGALERLSDVWRFATGAVCRHKQLVEHFGQAYEKENCGACDVCMGELEALEESTVVAQKILSCVVRCGQRYGAAHITDVLRGADTARVRRSGHDTLTTHGLLKDSSAREVRNWIEQLQAHGCLAVTPGEYPTLYLAQPGLEVLQGERDLTLLRPVEPHRPARKRRRAAAALDEGIEPDEALFERLRKFRRELARERGVPPYVIFNDRTLALMAAQKPRNADEFRALKGVGERKSEDLGPLFLAEIEAYLAPAE